MIAKKYNQRPSNIMEINNDYLAYCFDETAMFLEDKATDKEGTLNWGKIKWSDSKKQSNEDLINFSQTGK